MEPNTKLFPAVFCLPSSQNMLQVELGKLKVSYLFFKTNVVYKLYYLHVKCTIIPIFIQNIMPISAAMFRSDCKNPVPQCPPRLDLQMLTPVIWSRMPNHFLSPETGRVSERQGWKVQCLEPLVMMALHIPEENRYYNYMEILFSISAT